MNHSNRVNKYVFNIKPLVFISILAGLYHDVNLSRRIILLIKTYCVLLATILLWFTWSFFIAIKAYFVLIEYVAFVLFFFCFPSTIISDVKFIACADNFSASKTLYKKLEKTMLCINMVSVLLKLFSNLIFCFTQIGFPICETNMRYLFSYTIIELFMILGRNQFTYVFFVLYCRVKVFRINFESQVFTGRHSMKRYIQIYCTILDCYDESYSHLKPMV